MHMDDLWFDVAIRGEASIEDALIARLQLSDGSESGPEGSGAKVDSPALEPFGPDPAVDLF